MTSLCLKDGTYGIKLQAAGTPKPPAQSALAVLRRGRIVGADRTGSAFSGSHCYDTCSGLNRVHLRLEVPPEGELITGFSAGIEGAVVDIVGALRADETEGAPLSASAIVDIAGRPLEVTLTFLAPPPG